MSFNKHQFRDLIERTLDQIGLRSVAAVELLLGTAAQESQFGTYLRQITGPALGAFQIEPTTFDWLRIKYASRRPELAKRYPAELEWDLRLGIIMARLRYLADPKPLAAVGDILGHAHTWKRVYNTPLGAGTVEEFMDNWHKYVE